MNYSENISTFFWNPEMHSTKAICLTSCTAILHPYLKPFIGSCPKENPRPYSGQLIWLDDFSLYSIGVL